MCLLHLCLLKCLFNHLLVPLDLYLEYPVLIFDRVELLVVLGIVILCFFHAALHDVALAFNLRVNDLLVDQMHSLSVRVKSCLTATTATYFFH